jgi:hypothetical protein
MPNKDIVVMSESEIDGENVEDCLRNSIKNIQQGLCNVETHLIKMIESDEIDAKMWSASHECNVELKNLIMELIMICKEIKPSAKALKVARETIQNEIKEFEQQGLNV